MQAEVEQDIIATQSQLIIGEPVWAGRQSVTNVQVHISRTDETLFGKVSFARRRVGVLLNAQQWDSLRSLGDGACFQTGM